MSPLLEVSNPAIVFKSVDFPHPDGPSKTKKYPFFISKLIPFKTSVDPKCLFNLLIFKVASIILSLILLLIL